MNNSLNPNTTQTPGLRSAATLLYKLCTCIKQEAVLLRLLVGKSGVIILGLWSYLKQWAQTNSY